MIYRHSLVNRITTVFSSPFIFHYIRYLFNFGFNEKHVKKLLSPNENDMILDVGCGIGYYSNIVELANYLGVDYNNRYIEFAKARYANNKKHFITSDFLTQSLPTYKIKPNKCLLIGILHHLNDTEINQLLDKLKLMNFEFIIIQEPFYSSWHLINNVICSLDRGNYVRSISAYKNIIENHYEICSSKIMFQKNLLTNHVIFKVQSKSKLKL